MEFSIDGSRDYFVCGALHDADLEDLWPWGVGLTLSPRKRIYWQRGLVVSRRTLDDEIACPYRQHDFSSNEVTEKYLSGE